MATGTIRDKFDDRLSDPLGCIEDTYRHVEAAHAHVEEARGTTAAKAMDKAGETYDAGQATVAVAQNTISALQPLYEADTMKSIRDGITAFVEGLPGVLKALDEVANIHPFIKVAVGAFRVVVELDMKRRDNEKKITLLFVEMKDMMEVLVQLRTVEDEDEPGPDGTTIKARLQSLVAQSADDIKDCANACDTYSKKKLLVKVIKSSSWDDKFKSYLTLFADRRKAFTFALEMHVGKAVDDANRKLNAIDKKMSAILSLFSTLIPPEQQRLSASIGGRGGLEAVLADDGALVSLSGIKIGSTAKHSPGSGRDELKDLREEILETTDAAVRKNLDTFERKFLVQHRRLMVEMQGLVRHEGDRIIDTVLSGPHDRIRNQAIHEVWKEMRWRGYVKARYFILALRDFYLQHVPNALSVALPDSTVPMVAREDMWALKYVDVQYISAIAEACDEDTSGFITIQEINKFTSSRPQGWSLLHWFAYWAIGWRMTSTYYCRKIDALLKKMCDLLPTVRPENFEPAIWYLHSVWRPVTTLTAALERADVKADDAHWARFSEYVESEERRLEEGLKTFQYYIDDTDTLALITGPGRIEQFLFPILYLLIRRDYDIFRLCHEKVVINEDELVCSYHTITEGVLSPMGARITALESSFKQRGDDPGKQFETFACGLFKYAYRPEQLWSFEKRMEPGAPDLTAHEELAVEAEEALPEPDRVLFRPTLAEGVFVNEQDTLYESDLRQTSTILKNVLGRWHGFFGIGPDRWPAFPMVTFFLHASESNPGTFEATSRTASGICYTVTGRCSTRADDGLVDFTAAWRFAGASPPRSLHGVLSEDGLSISGTWNCNSQEGRNDFHFTRLDPVLLTARSSPHDLREHRIWALWRYALLATSLQVKRRRLSWEYIKRYIARRNAFIVLYEASASGKELCEEDYNMLITLHRALTCEEICYCFVVMDVRKRASALLSKAFWCNRCMERIPDARYICIPCTIGLDDDSCDLCDRPGCRDATIRDANYVHRPTHDMLKARRFLFSERDLPGLFRAANETIKRVDEMLRRDRPAADGAALEAGAGLSCALCSKEVEPPFFACVDCAAHDETIYICTACDKATNSAPSGGTHDPGHTLVRYLSSASRGSAAEGSVEARLRARELQGESHAGQLAALTERMSRIEGMLERTLSVLSRIAPPEVNSEAGRLES
ncbi:hypothetical protein C8Q77DRAFT_1157911 [Trametes polyzona]|nr:hypothetical protein C8Q77DRAFT_1157911 [Trametes polyzona]